MIIYLHGFASSGKAYKAQLLRKFLPDIDVISPDLPLEPIRAIKAIEYGYGKLSFFVIDRVLPGGKEPKESGQSEYLLEEVPQIIEEKVVRGFEGDWLFLLLLDKYFKFKSRIIVKHRFSLVGQWS